MKFSRRVEQAYFNKGLPYWVRLAIRRMPDAMTMNHLAENSWPGRFWKWPGL